MSSSLGLSTTQEYIIGAGLVGVAGVLLYYEYEKSKEPDQGKEGICRRIGDNIPWWEEVGAVIATAGLAIGAVGALEACKWYEAPPGIKQLEGSVKIGVFQGTWKTVVTADGTGWDLDCDNPIVLYGQYTYGQIGDLRKQYKGRENYLIYKPEDLDYWKSMCKTIHAALKAGSDANAAIMRKVAAVNDALSAEYKAAFTANQPFPFTESYIRAKCNGAGLVGSTADGIVFAWMGEAAVYNQRVMAARYDSLYGLFTSQAVSLFSAATHPGVRWPPIDTLGSAQPMDNTMLLKLQDAEINYVKGLQDQLFAKFPPLPNQDALMNTLVASYSAAVTAARPTKQWPAAPDYVDYLNQGLDAQHAELAAASSKAILDAARSQTK